MKEKMKEINPNHVALNFPFDNRVPLTRGHETGDTLNQHNHCDFKINTCQIISKTPSSETISNMALMMSLLC